MTTAAATKSTSPFSRLQPFTGFEALERHIGSSKFARARRRISSITALGNGSYELAGQSQLGDHYDTYNVVRDPRRRRSVCSCQSHMGGETRGLCTHILATMIHEQTPTYTPTKPTRSKRQSSETQVGLFALAPSTERRPSNLLDALADLGVPMSVLESKSKLESKSQSPSSSVSDRAAVDSTSTRTPTPASITDESTAENQAGPPEPQSGTHSSKPKTAPDHISINRRIAAKTSYPKPNQIAFIIRLEHPDGKPHQLDHIITLPTWTTAARPAQLQAAIDAVDHFLAGRKCVICQLPTGFGKTLFAWIVAELIRAIFTSDPQHPANSVYTATTKSLQDQAQKDFPEARTLKGKSNYPTELFPERHRDNPNRDYLSTPLSCEDCEKSAGAESCKFCRAPFTCPYRVAKKEALKAPLAILNTAAFLCHANYVPPEQTPLFFHHPLVILDEADELEKALLSFVEVVIGPRRLAKWNIGLPARKTKPETWGPWITDEALPAARAERDEIKSSKALDTIARRQKLRPLDQLIGQLELIAEELEDGWVFDGYNDAKPKAIFRPVRVDKFGQPYLWRHNKFWLVMSATIISNEVYADELGLEPGSWAAIEYPSSFPINRHTIRFWPAATLSAKTEEDSFPKIVRRVAEILDLWPNERILIHTVSYGRAKKLLNSLSAHHRRRCLTYDSAGNREAILAQYRRTPGCVLLAPSFERGIDLKHDDCRVQILIKVPFLSPADKQVAARLFPKTPAGELWYAVQTIRSIVQMTGRGMRAPDDWCQTYILDGAFDRLWRQKKRFFPRWWRDHFTRNDDRDLTPAGPPDTSSTTNSEDPQCA